MLKTTPRFLASPSRNVHLLHASKRSYRPAGEGNVTKTLGNITQDIVVDVAAAASPPEGRRGVAPIVALCL